MERQPAVAGRFYPAEPERLRALVAGHCAVEAAPAPALAVVAPHAGFVFSGHTAGQVFGRVEVPQTVVVLGPNHTGLGRPLALYPGGAWQMPMGAVPIAETLTAQVLAQVPGVEADALAHLREHGIEAHVPYLQHRQPALRLVALVTRSQGLHECEAIGLALARLVAASDEPVLLSASTDMTHFRSARDAERLDRMALERVLALDPAGLYETVRRHEISMCGVVPTTIVLFAARALGAHAAELVEYTHSGVVTGDLDSVVGYAGVVIR